MSEADLRTTIEEALEHLDTFRGLGGEWDRSVLVDTLVSRIMTRIRDRRGR
jgi:hypothetical protein